MSTRPSRLRATHSEDLLTMDNNGNGKSTGNVLVAERTTIQETINVTRALPVEIPAPTREYRTHRKVAKATEQPGLPIPKPPIPLPPILFNRGSRVLIYKQDPTVKSLGI